MADFWDRWGRLELSAAGPLNTPVSLDTYFDLQISYRGDDEALTALSGAQWSLDTTGPIPAVMVTSDEDLLLSDAVANPVSATYLYRAPTSPPPGIREAVIMVFREIFNSLNSDMPWQTPNLERRVDVLCQGYGRNWGIA